MFKYIYIYVCAWYSLYVFVIFFVTSSPNRTDPFRDDRSLRSDPGRSFVMIETEKRGLDQLARATGASLDSQRECTTSFAGMRMYAVGACGAKRGHKKMDVELLLEKKNTHTYINSSISLSFRSLLLYCRTT